MITYMIPNNKMATFHERRNNLIAVQIALLYWMCFLDAAKYLPKDELTKTHRISVSARKHREMKRASELLTQDKMQITKFSWAH